MASKPTYNSADTLVRRRLFYALLEQERLPLPEAEHKFHPKRQWMFDYAWPRYQVALEVEGGVWSGGRHTQASGFLLDMEKYNTASIMGWRLVRCQPKDLLKVKTIVMVRCAMTMATEPWDALIVKRKGK